MNARKGPLFKPGAILIHMFFIVYSLCCILPFFLILSISLTTNESIFRNGYQLIPEELSLGGYKFLLTDYMIVLRSYGVSIAVTLAGVFVTLLINSLFAYAISRDSFRYRKIFSLLVVVSLLFSAGLAPTYLVYVNILGLKDSLISMILPGLTTNVLGFGSGFYIFVMRQYFRENVPKSVLESAKIDGASETVTFFTIVLALAKPVLATVGLFTTLMYWNNFVTSMLFINNQNMYNLQYLMQRSLMNLQFVRDNFDKMIGADVKQLMKIPAESVRMAMVFIGIGPLIFAYPFFQKYFIKGLTIGSVKG